MTNAQYTVYVITLSNDVLKDRKFKEKKLMAVRSSTVGRFHGCNFN